MIQGIIIIVVFLILAALMILRKVPTVVAMIVLAILTAIIAGVPIIGQNADGDQIGWLHVILQDGAMRMSGAIGALIFGAWLGQLMNRSGITETIIKKSAEFGGDRPLVVALILMVANALLFTTLSGLGSVIMVGSILLPILISVGIPATMAGALFLMSFNIGLTFNMVNWQTFSGIFGLEIPVIRNFMTYMLVVTTIATVVFVIVEFKRNGRKFAFSAPVEPEKEEESNDEARQLKGVLGFLAVISPLIPIALVVFLDIPVIPAFMAGIVWLTVFTAKSFSKAMNMLVKTCFDGITAGAPAIILFVALGMLFLSVTNPIVKEVLDPFLLAIIPSSIVLYIVFFSVLAPLSLYRGPLNLFGFGSGIAALIIALGTLNPQAVMGAFLSSERIQGAGCPTNTQNVWTANFVKVDVNNLTRKVVPYLWCVAVAGVIISAILFF